MNHTVSIISFLRQLIGAMLSRVRVQQKSSIVAYKSYEKKARHDFQRTNKVPLDKSERLTPAALLCLNDCRTVDEAIKILENGVSPDTYIMRLVYIWDYYEHIDIA